MVHFTWTELLPNIGHDNVHISTAAISVIVLAVIAVIAKLALGSGEKAITPSGVFSTRGVMEVIVEAVSNIAEMVIGDKGRTFVPLFATVFLFIFINNALGLFPGMSASTSDINTTLAVGLFSFLAYNYYGIKEHGFAYIKQFLGPLWWLAFLMLPIELISHAVRPLSLGLRLQGNMFGDHTVLGIFLDLAPYGVPVIFYGLGLFVCFLQAFVFTLLSMIYVSMAISHDH